ncbi:hypothetical protein HDU97_008090 [Phlyctochytrium planicorne]|nr:hypothetical protein HDU97_008090 [Phlyctochytrium planicorne]
MVEMEIDDPQDQLQPMDQDPTTTATSPTAAAPAPPTSSSTATTPTTKSKKSRSTPTNPNSVTLSSRSNRRAAAARSTYGSPSDALTAQDGAAAPAAPPPAPTSGGGGSRKRARKSTDGSPSKGRGSKAGGLAGAEENHGDELEDITVSTREVGNTRLTFPVPRVKAVMKEDPEVHQVAGDAAVLMSMATEVFLEFMTQKAWQYTQKDDRKTIAYKDVARVVQYSTEFDFLDDVIPKTVPLRRALEEKKALAVDFANGTMP